jgi:Asp-tRNA(Asn)/Glu-tRNA(Gln) amidotransferase A subunit family amidase
VGDELTGMSASELAEVIAAGRVSPVEVIEALLERIDDLDPVLHAFVTVDAERALEAARQAEAAVQRHSELGPLHGVPVALKDETWTRGMAATAGSLLFKRFFPSRSGTVSERLERAGAVVIGKTNMPEFAAWPRSKSRVAGEALNPWDLTRISGASSGGSAAAVAAGLVPVAIGSDGGGSTRIPSALCGTVGLFPTPGRVPSYGSFSYSPFGSLGPIARTVRDVALVQQVIAGPDPRDATALSEPAPDVLATLESSVEGIRVAWTPDFGRIDVDPRIAAAGRALLDLVAGRGVRVDDLDTRIEHPWGDGSAFAERQQAVMAATWELDPDPDIPDISPEQEWMWKVFATDTPLCATAEFQDLCRRHIHLLTPPAQITYRTIARPDDTHDSMPEISVLRAAMEAVHARYDVICSPTMARVAPVAQPGWATPYPDAYMGTDFTFIANTTGCSAASVPSALVDGLPAGLQVIGRPGDEATVLRVCRALETVAPLLGRPPIAAVSGLNR